MDNTEWKGIREETTVWGGDTPSPVVLCTALPTADEVTEEIRAYYTALRGAAEAYCARLSPLLTARREADPDPQKRFRRAPLTIRITCHAVLFSGFLSVLRTTEIRLRGRTAAQRESEVFSLADGTLVPLARFIPRRSLLRLCKGAQFPDARSNCFSVREGGILLMGQTKNLLIPWGAIGGAPRTEKAAAGHT